MPTIYIKGRQTLLCASDNFSSSGSNHVFLPKEMYSVEFYKSVPLWMCFGKMQHAWPYRVANYGYTILFWELQNCCMLWVCCAFLWNAPLYILACFRCFALIVQCAIVFSAFPHWWLQVWHAYLRASCKLRSPEDIRLQRWVGKICNNKILRTKP